MLLGEVGKLREERRNIQLSVVISRLQSSRLLTDSVKLALCCAWKADAITVASLIQTGE